MLACLDALSGAFDAIEADGVESLDPAPLVERLHGLVRARTAEQALDRAGRPLAPGSGGRDRAPASACCTSSPSLDDRC